MECIPRSPLPLPALASLLARAETKVKNDGRKRERERERESVDGLRRGEGDREGGKRKSYPPLFFLLAVSAVGKKKYGADRRGGREDEEAAGSGKMRKGGGGGGFSFSFFSPGFPLGRRRGPPPLYPIFLLVSKCVASCTSFPPSSINYLAHSLFSNPASFFSQSAARRSLGGPGPRAWRGWPGYETKKRRRNRDLIGRCTLPFCFFSLPGRGRRRRGGGRSEVGGGGGAGRAVGGGGERFGPGTYVYVCRGLQKKSKQFPT